MWNIGFWMNAKPCYEERTYTQSEESIDFDRNFDELKSGKLHFELDAHTSSYKRFKGYLYRGGIYWDNPGVQCSVDSDTREHWFNKKWI